MKSLLLSLISCFLTCLCLAQTPSTKSELSALNPLPALWSDLPDGTVADMIEWSWPWDDRLCDSYDESNGEGVFLLYQLMDGTLLRAEEFGAYCQGDSEYGYSMSFDLQGRPLYYETGYNMYVSQSSTVYVNGIPEIEVVVPSNYDMDPAVHFQTPENAEMGSAATYLELGEEQNRILQRRKQSLIDLIPSLENADDRAEANQLIHELDSLLLKGPTHIPMILRLPGQNENDDQSFLRVNGVDVPIYEAPGLKAAILSEISFYDCWFHLLEIGHEETHRDWGKSRWYKVRFFPREDVPAAEGWIFGSFLQRDFFPQ